jgi:RNA polymerase sigma-B factor
LSWFVTDDPASERTRLTADALARAATAAPAERAGLLREVVRLNLTVARDVTRRFRGRGVPTEDLEQVAYLGLVLAARRFDPTKAADFLSFAVPTIRGELRRHFRDQGWMVRPPRSIQELQPRMQAAYAELSQELGRQPADGEVADRLGVPVQRVEESRAAQGAFSPASIDAAAADGWPVTERLVSEEGGYAEVEDKETVRALTRSLSQRDLRLLELRFWRDRSQSEIGREVGVAQSQVSRHLDVLLQRLRAVDSR